MKVFIIIILVVIASFFYYRTNVVENIEQDVKNTERCAEFERMEADEDYTFSYGVRIRQTLKGCF